MASVARYCCCIVCEENVFGSCSHCDTYYNYDITTSSIVVVTGCYDVGGGFPGRKITSILTSVNGTAKTAVGAACEYVTNIGSIKIEDHFNNTCTASFTSSSAGMILTLVRTSTKWTLTGINGDSNLLFFYDEQSVDASDSACTSIPAFTNDLVVGDIGNTHGATGLVIAGHSGNATVACHPA